MHYNQQHTFHSNSSLGRPVHQPKIISHHKKTLDDYEFVVDETSKIKTSDLGNGAYGIVKRVRDKQTNEIFAMKIMSKQTIFAHSSKENLKREIKIQKSIMHPHIISLYHYFEDKDNVYIVLEYADNKTLFEYIRNKKSLPENEAFIYFFQTALGISYLHKRSIIHRDLKPENLLLDKNGNIKLCDFGWSAKADHKRFTYCGTVDYMAPEIVKNLPYDHHVDIWSLGILLYELLHGFAPFLGKTDQQKLTNIAKSLPINFDQSLSPEARDLITKILRPAPMDRLSMDEIFRHPWMKKHEKVFGIDIQAYVEQEAEIRESSSILEDSQMEQSFEASSMARRGPRKASLYDEVNRSGSLDKISKPKIITIIDDATPVNMKMSPPKSEFANQGKYLLPRNGQYNNSTGNMSTEEGSRSSSEVAQMHYLLKGYENDGTRKSEHERATSIMQLSNESQKSSFSFRAESMKSTHQDNLYPQETGRANMSARENIFGREQRRNMRHGSMAETSCQRSLSSAGAKPFTFVKESSKYKLYDQEEEYDSKVNKMGQKNVEIGKMFKYGKQDKNEPSYIEKILMGLGCIAKRNNHYGYY